MTQEEIYKLKLDATTSLVNQLTERGLSVTSNCREWALRAYELRELGADGSRLYHRLSQLDCNYDSRGTTANFHSACRKQSGDYGERRTLRAFFNICYNLNLQVPEGFATWRDFFHRLYPKGDTPQHSQPPGVLPDDEGADFLPSLFMQRSLSTRSTFCQALVTTGLLTESQMLHAARRYQLGARVDESVVFWQIDHDGNVCDGKVMHYDNDCHRSKDTAKRPTTMSALLKSQRDHDGNQELRSDWRGHSCLFGEHLIAESTAGSIVAIVESEKTAVILSEWFPEVGGSPVTWLATGGVNHFNVSLLAPIADRRIVVFPDTDTTGDTYRRWQAIAQKAPTRHPVYVSPLLERHATTQQKAQKADLADWV